MSLTKVTKTVTSSIGADDGTAAAPSISFGNDSDTGLYSSAANQIDIATGGVSRFRLSSTGQQSSTVPDLSGSNTTLYPEYKCRAWANYAGTTLYAGGNVSSITTPAGGGTGWRQINFTTSMPNANYAVTLANWPNFSMQERPCVGGTLNVAFVIIHNREVVNGTFYDSPVYMAVHR